MLEQKLIASFDKTALVDEKFDDIYKLVEETRNDAHNAGLLALDSRCDDENLPSFFRRGLRMVVDGTDPQDVRIELEKLILPLRSNKQSYAASILFYIGVLSIQMGDSRALIRMKFASMKGCDALKRAIQEY
jgi:flagellar motor component MotA